jgi:hypothetical protein
VHIYQLVPSQARPIEAELKAIPHHIPSIDLRCSRCGASQTYALVPEGDGGIAVRLASKQLARTQSR